MPSYRNSLGLVLVGGIAVLIAGCSDQAEAPDAAPAPVVLEATADAEAQAAVVAFGLTRPQMEAADLKSEDGTVLGAVDILVLDPAGQLEAVVVSMPGTDRKVAVPRAALGVLDAGDGTAVALVTDLSAAEVSALPDAKPAAG